MAIDVNDPRLRHVWTETFDDPALLLTHFWGDTSGVSFPGDGAMHMDMSGGQGGVMQFPGGPDYGQGDGLYTVRARLYPGEGGGAAVLLWPANDQWPGFELDLLEATDLERREFFVTFHWPGPNGENLFDWHLVDRFADGSPIDLTQYHDYALLWESREPATGDPGRLTFMLDGQELVTTTRNVPADFEHGGHNEAVGVMLNSASYGGRRVRMDVDHAEYRSLEDGPPATP
jgi:hypothetical protein